ncbi:MAG: hypothetical protein J5570_07635 [Lachnospiraceae bacterium]|nr:hypothetical protein [Lachnospiraceae bacterium]
MNETNRSAVTEPDPIPPSFRYRDVYIKGKPKHDVNDIFRVRHPAMDLSRRAKIFSPFDALKGFGDELSKAEREVVKDVY